MPGGAPPGPSGSTGSPGPAGAPSTGQGASPEGQQNPALKNALSQLTAFANMARQYAQAYPQAAPEMRQIGELLQKVLMKTTQAQKPSEPAAPPV